MSFNTIIYCVLFAYIAFEAFFKLFARYGDKLIKVKKKLFYLKETGSFIDYFVYIIKKSFISFTYSVWNREVLIGLIFYIVHHNFIVTLMNKAGEDVHLLETWTNVGIVISFIFAALLSVSENSEKSA